MPSGDEERLIRIAALRNAEEILLARNRAERELSDAKQTLERKNQELQQQRELLHVTLSSIGDAVITTDSQGNVTFLNPIAETMTGWTSPQAAGQPVTHVFNIIDEFTHAPVPNPIGQVLREGIIVGLANHTSLVSRSGAITSIEDSAAPIHDSTGKITGAVMVFHDVTARRRTEAALSASERRFRTIFNQAAVGIAVIDLTARLMQANQKFADIFGYTVIEIQQRTFAELVHESGLAKTEAHVQRLVAGELSDLVLETRCVRKDGSLIWTLSTLTLVKDPDGRPLHLIGIVEDISQRKLAEEAQARLVAVIASSDDSIISMTLDGVVMSWNHGAERMYSYTANEMIGRSTTELIPSDRQDEESAILQRIRRGERTDPFETLRRKKDGTLIDVSIAVSPIEDMRGNIIGASKITRDITEKKQAEAKLRDADRRKDEFLAILAHELRNPLAPIRQAALLSKTAGATEAQKRWSHDVIDRQVHNMSLLLDDLLDISRVTRGTLELRLAPTEVAEVIEAAVETARPAIEAKQHHLSVVKPDTPMQLIADPLRLAQVLANLLTNAAKYTDPQGTIELHVVATEHEVALTVRDSGIGISPEMLGNVFDMFAQIKSSKDRSEGGLGIGLALSKGLVELHGGHINARSGGLSHGSEFTVRLPRRAASIVPTRAANNPLMPDVVRRRIIVADDNRDAAETLAKLLELEGHEVHIVHDGPAALAALAEFSPEVALLDIGMPGLSGYEIARQARKSSQYRPMVLIALTGWGRDRDIASAIAAGFDYHFTKPVELNRITEILHSLPKSGAA